MIVRDRLWALAEASAAVTGMVRSGNRAKIDTNQGWMKAYAARGAVPLVVIGNGRATYSAYGEDATFDRENADFAGDWPVVRTWAFPVKSITDVYKPEDADALEEALQNAFLAGGPKLCNPAKSLPDLGYIRSWGPMAAIAQKDTQADPSNFGRLCRVNEFTVPVTVELDGAKLLAGVQE
jgi:hypothetical protein